MNLPKLNFLFFTLLACLLFAVGIQAEPYFSLFDEEDWLGGMEEGYIQPMTPYQWDDYMYQWETFTEEGEPYPENEFVSPELYVYEGGGSGGAEPNDAGLVMYWGTTDMPPGEYSSAWLYDFKLDPDLSNSTITITVMAPQFDLNGNQINTVSLGMRDINGNIRSWNFKCGGAGDPIQWNISTTITINTLLTGVAAANPTASGYANNPAFDITKVLVLIVDENASWVGGPTPIPPPGTTIPKPWNYWENLSVTANTTGGAIIAGINIDVHQDVNIPGVDVNDFHIEGRIESGIPLSMGGGGWANPPVLVTHVDDLFPNFKYTITPDSTDPEQNWFIIEADWSTDTPIPYCTILHLGLEFEVTCHNVIIDIVGWWTSNGQPIGQGNNGGFVPIPGFRVEDNIGGPIGQQPQILTLQNGNGDGQVEPGEIDTEIVQMDLVGIKASEITELLGSEPFTALRIGGLQETLPWIPIENEYGPISTSNHIDFPAESFFDVFFDVIIPDQLHPAQPITLNGGDFLIVRELLQFTNNDGQQDFRWVWEIHEAHEGKSDLGDAPDSTNSFGAVATMTAYPSGVQADYPTVYQAGSPPHGPLHLAPAAVAHLGQAVTREQEADIGWDQDPTNNIIPPANQANRDFADDGILGMPLKLPHCTWSKFDYLVNVITPGIDLYVNVWADWNRDGDWNDTLLCPDGTNAPEWAVQDQLLTGLPVGVNKITTPLFMPWHPTNLNDPIWLRITLSEQPWTGSGSGGSGPAGGYQYGETEDYYFVPKIGNSPCADFTLDGIVNFRDLAVFAAQWLGSCP